MVNRLQGSTKEVRNFAKYVERLYENCVKFMIIC